jgi:hypothetical protein
MPTGGIAVTHDSRPTLVDLAANPTLAAEVDLDRIPEVLGEMERLRAILWARLALRINRPAPTEDRLLVTTDAASRAPRRTGCTGTRTAWPSPFAYPTASFAPKASTAGSRAASPDAGCDCTVGRRRVGALNPGLPPRVH